MRPTFLALGCQFAPMRKRIKSLLSFSCHDSSHPRKTRWGVGACGVQKISLSGSLVAFSYRRSRSFWSVWFVCIAAGLFACVARLRNPLPLLEFRDVRPNGRQHHLRQQLRWRPVRHSEPLARCLLFTGRTHLQRDNNAQPKGAKSDRKVLIGERYFSIDRQ